MDRVKISLECYPKHKDPATKEDVPAKMAEVEVLKTFSMADKRRVAAANSIQSSRRDGDSLAALANIAFQVADVPDEDLAGLSPYEQLILGRHLADWIVEGDRPSS